VTVASTVPTKRRGEKEGKTREVRRGGRGPLLAYCIYPILSSPLHFNSSSPFYSILVYSYSLSCPALRCTSLRTCTLTQLCQNVFNKIPLFNSIQFHNLRISSHPEVLSLLLSLFLFIIFLNIFFFFFLFSFSSNNVILCHKV
jgi:hypothetical protein